MLTAPWLQSSGWHFDLRSALIGAVGAWVIAFFVYRNREAIQQLLQKLWEPVTHWRRKLQSSTEEKYLNALQKTLKGLLLFAPQDPQAIFVPPTYLAPAPVASSDAGDKTIHTQPITFENLLKGHSKVLMTGPQSSGRTTTLAMLVWEIAEQDEQQQKPYRRFPLWIDLEHFTSEQTEVPPTIEALADLAVQFFPQAYPKWIISQLQSYPSLILVDNWDALPAENRRAAAQWLDAIMQILPDSFWVAATSPEGYGPLVETGFVPLTIIPPSGENTIQKIYTGWASLLTQEEPETQEEILYTLQWAAEAGANLLELTLRTVLYLRTGQLPNRPAEVMEALLDTYTPAPDLGEDLADVAQDARALALTLLTQIAQTTWIEKRPLSKQEVQERLQAFLPPEEERHPKLENETRRLLQNTPILRQDSSTVTFSHYAWETYFVARSLAEEPAQEISLAESLHDPTQVVLLDYYAGLGNAVPLVKALLQESITPGGHSALIRVSRWAILAPEEAAWRKVALKALAQFFVKPTLSNEERLDIGRMLALVAGQSVRPFYLQSLRSSLPSVQGAAIRGLGWIGTPQDMKVMAAALNDEHFEIQESAIHALADLGTTGAMRFLSDSLTKSDEQVMLLIAETLANNPDGWESLKEATDSPDLLVRRAAVHGLGKISQPWAKEILQHIVREDEQWLVRSAAEAALSTQTDQEETNTVTAPPKIDEMQWLISWAAKQGLGLGIGEAALQMLLRALDVGEPDAQILAIETLIQIGRQEHLEVLNPLTENEDPRVQESAKAAIEIIERRYKGIP